MNATARTAVGPAGNNSSHFLKAEMNIGKGTKPRDFADSPRIIWLRPFFYKEDLYGEKSTHGSKRVSPHICPIPQEEADQFLDTVGRRTDILSWEEKYDDPDVCDGHEWDIRAVFPDDTVMSIYGHQKYPRHYTRSVLLIEWLSGRIRKKHDSVLTGEETNGYFH